METKIDAATKTPANVLFAGVTHELLNEWKATFKELVIITVNLNPNETLTAYFKKPDVQIKQECAELANANRLDEAQGYLLNNTFLGGDNQVLTNPDASLVAQGKLWYMAGFLTASAFKV